MKNRKLLMIPGPIEFTPEVLRAMGMATTSHIALGEATGATPDGRRAKAWLSEGVSPVQGHDKKGPTAAAKSVGKLDHARCNGTLLNLKINPQCLKRKTD